MGKNCALAMLFWALLLFHAGARERVLVLTDISNEPDDEQSLVRFLVYSNEYQIEGIIATTSQYLRKKPREDLIRRQIAAYSTVKDKLSVHADQYPDARKLLKVTATGQPGYGMTSVGEGRQSPGSRLLLEAADRDHEKPLWISVWGGANTLAQALFDARRQRSADELKKLVSRLRVYTISDQDDAGRWLRQEFPGLFYIVTPSSSWKEYYRATWTGISGDRYYRNAPMVDFHLVDNPWLEEHVIKTTDHWANSTRKAATSWRVTHRHSLALWTTDSAGRKARPMAAGAAGMCFLDPTRKADQSGPTTTIPVIPSR